MADEIKAGRQDASGPRGANFLTLNHIGQFDVSPILNPSKYQVLL